MTAENKDTVDELYEYGAKELSIAARKFLDESQRRGMALPDAILLFVTLLISQSLAVLKAMVPDDGTCELIVEMVRDQWIAMKDEPNPKAN